MRLLEDDERYPEKELRYKRVQWSNVDPCTPMGPDYNRQWWWPVEVNDNIIGFSLVPPDGYDE